MKRTFTQITFLLISIFIHAQTFSDIQAPSSPGMSIIGIQNSEISKPGNYAGLYTSLISPILSNNGTIPSNLSLEFSPYYLESRDVTINEISRTNLYRDLKISVASTAINPSDSVTFPRLGLGIKTILLNGKITVKETQGKIAITQATANDIELTIDKIELGTYGPLENSDISKLTEHINEKNKEVKKKIESIIRQDKDNQELVIAKLNQYAREIEKLIEIDDYKWNYSLRTGSFLELAGAFAIDFPANRFKGYEIKRWGVWLTYTYRPVKQLGIFDISSIIRISNHSFDPTVVFENKSLFGDYGGSLNLRVPKTGFNLAGEWIGKFGISDLKASENENQYTFKSVTENKWTFSIGYQITENSIFSMSFSEINGNSSYLSDNAIQLLIGINAALAPKKK